MGFLFKEQMVNRLPSREVVEHLRQVYKPGTRVVLTKMNDVQAPPIGTMGTVTGVDDLGSVLVNWDTGSSLSVVFGEDRCAITGS